MRNASPWPAPPANCSGSATPFRSTSTTPPPCRPGRTRLEQIRYHGFQFLKTAALIDDYRRPDVGGPALHPTAGAAILGARKLLIAYNVNLQTPDVAVAQRIAKRIRASSGGFPGVKALGVFLASRGLAQVTTTITDFELSPLHVVFNAIRDAAASEYVAIAGSQLIGLLAPPRPRNGRRHRLPLGVLGRLDGPGNAPPNGRLGATQHLRSIIKRARSVIQLARSIIEIDVLVSIDTASARPKRPQWLRAPAPAGENYRDLKALIDGLNLHTVCESAACPNVGECWNHRTATFMILGNVCTRRCGFCNVQKGVPLAVDLDEPRRVAAACAALGLRYAVVTSVNRDDRNDGGAALFAADHPRHSRGSSGLQGGGPDPRFPGLPRSSGTS